MSDIELPLVSKKRMKRKAAKELKRETKRKKFEENANKSGPPTITQSDLNETHIFIENGLRHVKNYPYTFHVSTKLRWYNRTILEIMVKEFRGPTIDHYIEAIDKGLIQVDGRPVKWDYLLQAHETIMHRIHRHEPPVSNEPIKIIYKDDTLVVVDKPASIPVHPTGRYRHNSVTFILAREHGLFNLYPVHRLDRLTSGLLLFARSPQKAELIAQQIRGTTVQKTYLARVVGEFPHLETDPEPLIVNQPILVSTDIGLRELNRVDENGKPSETHFRRLFFDGKHSLVLCLPKTGRTHQIRVHLNFLGHPIANDPLYNDEYRKLHAESWEIQMGENTKKSQAAALSASSNTLDNQNDQSIGNENTQHSTGDRQHSNPDSNQNHDQQSNDHDDKKQYNQEKHLDDYDEQDRHKDHDEQLNLEQKVGEYYKRKTTQQNNNQQDVNTEKQLTNDNINVIVNENVSDSRSKDVAEAVDINQTDPQPLCDLCLVKWRDPEPHELRIFLHALKYEGDGFNYQTEEPVWASRDYLKQ